MKKLLSAFAVLLAMSGVQASAQDVADMSDLEYAHIAYTADNIDIRHAHLALALSKNPDIHEFARTMIQDHTAVNEAALALLEKLGATAQDNPVSQTLNANAEEIIDGFVQLRGADFDKEEVRALFVEGLEIFKAHERHAEMMVKALQ